MSAQNPFAPGARYVPPQATEKLYSARSLVRFLSQAVQPPSVVYVESTDVLRITAATSQFGEVVTINYRLLLPSGDIVLGQGSVAPNNSRAIAIHDEPMAEGFLLSVSVRAAVAATRGQTFVRVFLTDPDLGAGMPSYQLMADYVTTAMAPGYPNGRVLAPCEGPGNLKVLTLSNVTGNDFGFVLPGNARWRVTAITALLTTSAAVATRIPRLFYTEDGTGSLRSPISAGVAASTATRFIFAAGAPQFAGDSTDIIGPLPVLLILSSFFGALGSIAFATLSLQAGDVWSNIEIHVEEWLDNV